jgi:dTDP-4-amino-4,6-dideoxygalactose transaminase
MDLVFDEGFMTNHTMVRSFEGNFASWNDSPCAVATSSGSSALEIIFRAVEVEGGEVLMPTNTFIATAMACLAAGGKPRLIDIESRYLSLDVEAALRAIGPTTKAVVIVHVAGMISPDVMRLRRACQDAAVPLIEDCAHAHGSSLQGLRAGNLGDAGAFSFHMTKTMTTGEGGMIVTANRDLAQRARSIREQGRSLEEKSVHLHHGGNFKMTEMQGLMGSLELERVEERLRKRGRLAKIYQERLSRTEEWTALMAADGSACGHYKQVLLTKRKRQDVESYLAANGVALTGGVYHHPLHRQPVMRDFVQSQTFPQADEVADHHICPPCYPELTEDEAHRICDLLERMP